MMIPSVVDLPGVKPICSGAMLPVAFYICARRVRVKALPRVDNRLIPHYVYSEIHTCTSKYFGTVDSVDSFVYVRSVFASNGYCQPDINKCTGGTLSVMSSLHLMWKNHRLSLTTKNPYLHCSSAV